MHLLEVVGSGWVDAEHEVWCDVGELLSGCDAICTAFSPTLACMP
jgi:hypothetical protein